MITSCAIFGFPAGPRLGILLAISQLCGKRIAMNATENQTDYEEFGRLIIEKEIHMNPAATFPVLCALIGADRKKLDARIREELGMSGETLLGALRAGVWK